VGRTRKWFGEGSAIAPDRKKEERFLQESGAKGSRKNLNCIREKVANIRKKGTRQKNRLCGMCGGGGEDFVRPSVH